MSKTFEDLYAQLTEIAATRPEGSGTVERLDAGVHAIGKKIVEEAAEVWMASEYQTLDETAEEIMALGFGASKFRFAAPANGAWTLQDLNGKRIATSYPGLLSDYLHARGISARLIHLDGAVESSIRLGVADAIADVVETGTTLRKAGLELFGDPILLSEAILVQRPQNRGDIDPLALAHLQQRLSGVIVARDYVLMDYDIPVEQVEEASALTPGLESPTISPLAKEGWVAVRVMVPARGHQLLMDHLHDLGARGILVSELSACRL